MKICILGPVSTSKYYGGVSNFTESLADGINRLGVNCTIITDYTEKSSTLKGTKITGLFSKPSRKDINLPKKLFDEVIKEKPDFVITSLEYGLVNKRIKDNEPKIKTAHFLHGFMSQQNLRNNNGFIKGNLIKHITKYICLNSDFVMANSSLTASMNFENIRVPSDSVINLGISYEFMNYLAIEKATTKVEKGNILYVGRLAKSKNIDKLISAVNKMEREVTLNIVGDGPELNNLKKIANGSNRVIFHGRKENSDLIRFYNNAEIFISLNPNESFGITYVEALASGCKLITPNTGGHLDVTLRYLERIEMVNPQEERQLINAICYLLNYDVEKLSDNYIESFLSFDNAAKKAISFFESYS